MKLHEALEISQVVSHPRLNGFLIANGIESFSRLYTHDKYLYTDRDFGLSPWLIMDSIWEPVFLDFSIKDIHGTILYQFKGQDATFASQIADYLNYSQESEEQHEKDVQGES